MMAGGVACDYLFNVVGEPLNPFRDLPAVAMDGRSRVMQYDVAPLGRLEVGQVIRVRVTGDAIDAVLILAEDDEYEAAGRLAGAGPANEFFLYRVQEAGRYFVYVLFHLAADPADRLATLTVTPGDAEYRPPTTQIVWLDFEEGYLTNPGLVDPASFTDEERALLAGISGVVRDEITERLRAKKALASKR
jgi:hypothetical protein